MCDNEPFVTPTDLNVTMKLLHLCAAIRSEVSSHIIGISVTATVTYMHAKKKNLAYKETSIQNRTQRRHRAGYCNEMTTIQEDVK